MTRTVRRLGVSILLAFVCATLAPISVSAAGPPSATDSSATEDWIVALRQGVASKTNAADLARAAGGSSGLTFEHALNGFAFKGSTHAAAALARNPNVRSVVPDGTFMIAGDAVTTGISRISAFRPSPPDAYHAGFRGAGARIAILDTGVDLTHPDLVAHLDLSLGLNCMTNPPGTAPPQDGHGHGTHVAGIAAAPVNNVGVIGVAPEARIVPIKVLDDTGYGEWSNLICAIDYLTGLATDGNPANDVDVANMSLGDTGGIGSCDDGFVREAICTSVAAGITYVAAAGNSTADTATFIPAAMPEVIAVSAITDLDGQPGGLEGCVTPWFDLYCDDTLAEFSNFGPDVDLTAPGYEVYSDWTGGGYSTASGTSMASPHVAGVAALVRAVNPALGPDDVVEVLKETGECANGKFADDDGNGDCVGNGEWGHDPDGYGEPLVNAIHAASAAGSWQPKPSISITSPANGASVSGVVNVTTNATSVLGIASVSFAVNGVPAFTDTNGSNGWSFAWDTTAIDPGVWALRATATDIVGALRSATVTVNAGTNVQGDWVGNYGEDGYILAAWNTTADLAVLPAGVTYALEQGGRVNWESTSEVRAVESPTQAERRATAWHDVSEVRVRLTFNTAYSGPIHLYALDWSTTDRRQFVSLDDGSGPRTVNLTTAPFNNGAWLHFVVDVPAGGSVVIRANRTAGHNSLISGIFLGGSGTPPPPPPSPPPPTVDIPGVQGDWVGNYGEDGYILAAWNTTADLAVLPAGVTYALEQGGRVNWESTSEVRAVESPTQAERRATAWHDVSEVRVRLTFNTAYSGPIHLYALDWSTTDRRQFVSLDDGSGPRTVNLTTAPFNNGAWLHFVVDVPAGGSVVIRANRTAGHNSLISGIFLGGSGTPPPPPPSPPPPTVDIPGVQGDWVGNYGEDGYILAAWNTTADLAVLPAGVTYALEQGGRVNWESTSEVRAVESPTQAERRATAWHDVSEVRVRLTFNTAYSGPIHLYALDWSTTDRRQFVSLDDGSGPRTVNLTTAPFNNGAWLHFVVDVPAGGSVVIRANRTAGHNSLISGIFLGGAPAVTTPGAPTGLAATPGNGQVALTWVPPVSNGGSPITGYTATASPGGATCSTASLGCTVSGLTNGTNYSFIVVATNSVGPGAASNPVTATPATTPGAPTNLAATRGNGQVALTWSAPSSNGGSAITGYTATASPGGATCSTPSLGCTVGGLTNGTAFSFTVVATNAIGPGPASSTVSATPATTSGAPTGLAATPGNGQVALTWVPPVSNGGSPITGYTATASPGGATCSTAALGCTVSGLTNGTAYSFTARATNSVGPGPASSPVTATPVAPANVPSAPTNLKASALRQGGIQLTWTAPASNGGSSITGYRIYRSTSSGTEVFVVAVGVVTSYVDNTAVGGARYYYKVAAVNAVGVGPLSGEANARAR